MSDNKRKGSRLQGANWTNQAPKVHESLRKITPKSVDNLPTVKYTEDKNLDLREKPKDIIITEDGEYELSSTSNGVSKIKFIQNFIDQKNSDWIFDQLVKELPWETRINKKYNTEEPRLSCWIGEHKYIYSGVEWAPLPFNPITEMLNDLLYEKINYKFNSVLCNLYRNEKDSVAWHSDDEPMLGKHPYIASLSFGDNRMFEMRRKIESNQPIQDYEFVQHIKIPLTHGSLVIMQGATQDDWQHQVPKEYHSRNQRMNLTFRTIYPS